MVYFFLAEGFEEIEALCPLDLLRRAGVDAKTVSITGDNTVTGSHGIRVFADRTAVDKLPDMEMLVLPGGMPGTRRLDESAFVDGKLDAALAQGAFIAAICAAPMILGKRGLLRGKKAICFPGYEKDLEGATVSSARVVRDGKIITAAGMGVSTEFGLALIEALKGKEKADEIARAVLYR